MNNENSFRYAPPREVEGGIKARSKRGEIAQTWWSRRFIDVLNSFGMGSRLQRGRTYARKGQVLSMSMATSVVTAQVQGSRNTPYRVRIAVKAFDADQWKRVEQALAEQALYAAKLLAGEMPTEIEDVFDSIGLRLFPDTMRELTMDCSCPDWEIPCKHLAAACYLLAESFDADPFAILAWRGRGREELLDRLRGLRGQSGQVACDEPVDDDVPLAECMDIYWSAAEIPSPPPPMSVPTRPDVLLDQLDPLPLTLRDRTVVDLLRPAYHAMAPDSRP